MDIAGPAGGTGTTRDKLWTGTVSVFARDDAASPSAAVSIQHYANVYGVSVAANGLEVVPILQIPAGPKLAITRADDWSQTLNIVIPCAKQLRVPSARLRNRPVFGCDHPARA
jgi:hypothetical protein